MIELKRLLCIFYANHRVVEAISTDVGSCILVDLLDRRLGDDLDPISIRIQNESNSLHTTIRKLLLELVSLVFQSLACRVDVVYTDTEMSEALVRLSVAIVHLVIVVCLRAVVVGELDDAVDLLIAEDALDVNSNTPFTTCPMLAGICSCGTIVGEEVEVELCGWGFDFVDEFHAQVLVEGDASLWVLHSYPNEVSIP